MSSLITKVKDALTGGDSAAEAQAANQGSSGYDNTTGSGSSLTGTSGHHTDNATGTTGSGSTNTTGHHTSTTAGTPGSGLTGSSGHGSTNVGPHSSNVANKVDPRVDSDLDGSRGMAGTTGQGHGSSAKESTGNTGQTYSSSTGSSGATGTGAPHGQHHGHRHEDIVHGGEHHSSTANRLDPNIPIRESATLGKGAQSSGSTGKSDVAGPHKSAMLNKLDPRVDSDLDGSKTVGGNKTYTGSSDTSNTGSSTRGTGSNTTGVGSGNTGNNPSTSGHSGIGSSTSTVGGSGVGAGHTVGSPNTPSVPLDAAKHTPSQFTAVQGNPTIAHDDPTHDRLGRHGSKVGDDLAKYGGGHE